MNDKPPALIIGATSGGGAEYARRLAQGGYDLILTGRRSELINALADELCEAHGSEVEVVIIELSDPNQVEDFIESIGHRNIQLLINNAGFGTTKDFHQEQKVICIPGRMTRMQVLMRHFIPEALYYKITGNYFRKYGWSGHYRSV